MTSAVTAPSPPRIVAALLRTGDRVLLCHRAPGRRWYPDVWDLPGGHVEPGESPAQALVRELREELGITVAEPASPPAALVRVDDLLMRVWVIESWDGVPTNVAPDEHDALTWVNQLEAGRLRLAHPEYPALLATALGP